MNINLLASLNTMFENWLEEFGTEVWFPRAEWTDGTTSFLARSTHDALMAIEASCESLKEQYETLRGKE